MKVTRAQVVAEARRWLRTPFGHQGRTLGRRIDCVGLPLMVAGALGLSDKSGKPLNGACYATYTSQPLGTYVHDVCMEHLEYKPLREMLPGDVVSISIATAPCHVGIITEDKNHRPCLLHAYDGGLHEVTEHILDTKWQRRIVGCFKFPEVID